MNKVSILCVTYNRRDLVLRCLKSCIEQDYPNFEIVVVINPSGDGTEEAIEQQFPEAKVIRTHKNLGFIPALNLAIANSVGDYLMMVDDDAYFLQQDALANLIAAFKNEPNLGAVTCTIEGPDEKRRVEKPDHYIEVFTTGFTMIPRKVHTEWIGFYPDLFFREASELYLCTKLWEMGKPVKRLQDVRMYHAFAMQGRPMPQFKFYALRDQILCAIMRDPLVILFPRILSKLLKSFIEFTTKGYFWTWVTAIFDALYRTPEALRYRDPINFKTQKMLWRLRKEKPLKL